MDSRAQGIVTGQRLVMADYFESCNRTRQDAPMSVPYAGQPYMVSE